MYWRKMLTALVQPTESIVNARTLTRPRRKLWHMGPKRGDIRHFHSTDVRCLFGTALSALRELDSQSTQELDKQRTGYRINKNKTVGTNAQRVRGYRGCSVATENGCAIEAHNGESERGILWARSPQGYKHWGSKLQLESLLAE